MAEVAGQAGEMVEMLALKALAHQAHYQVDQAFATLIQALKLTEPEGYVRTFVDEGLPMAQLLAQGIAFRQNQELRRAQDDPLGVYMEHQEVTHGASELDSSGKIVLEHTF